LLTNDIPKLPSRTKPANVTVTGTFVGLNKKAPAPGAKVTFPAGLPFVSIHWLFVHVYVANAELLFHFMTYVPAGRIVPSAIVGLNNPSSVFVGASSWLESSEFVPGLLFVPEPTITRSNPIAREHQTPLFR